MHHKQTQPQDDNKVEAGPVFETPDAYVNGSRKRLNKHFGGDWWLNVDYVESEIAA